MLKTSTISFTMIVTLITTNLKYAKQGNVSKLEDSDQAQAAASFHFDSFDPEECPAQ